MLGEEHNVIAASAALSEEEERFAKLEAKRRDLYRADIDFAAQEEVQARIEADLRRKEDAAVAQAAEELRRRREARAADTARRRKPAAATNARNRRLSQDNAAAIARRRAAHEIQSLAGVTSFYHRDCHTCHPDLIHRRRRPCPCRHRACHVCCPEGRRCRHRTCRACRPGARRCCRLVCRVCRPEDRPRPPPPKPSNCPTPPCVGPPETTRPLFIPNARPPLPLGRSPPSARPRPPPLPQRRSLLLLLLLRRPRLLPYPSPTKPGRSSSPTTSYSSTSPRQIWVPSRLKSQTWRELLLRSLPLAKLPAPRSRQSAR